MVSSIEHTRQTLHKPAETALLIDENPYKSKMKTPVKPISQVGLPAINKGRQDQSWSVEIPKRNQASELAVSVYQSVGEKKALGQRV